MPHDACEGVRVAIPTWRRIDRHRSNNTTNAPDGIGKPAGPTHIVEEVTVSPDGKHYSRTFTLDAYDTAYNRTRIVGVIEGTRITMGTTVDDLM